MNRRARSTGAPRALDNEDEELIQKAIEDKSTAHGRRHDAMLYVNHRVKKRFPRNCKLLFVQDR